MTIRKKSKEELQEQAKGFLDYAGQTGKITEKQKERISKILGISDSEKEGFFEWLSKRVGNWIYDEVKIGKKLTQGNLLHRGLEKYIDKKHDLGIYGGYSYAELHKDIYEKGYIMNFESLWEKYCYYLKFKKYFEKYKTSSDIVNYKFIDHLSSRFSDVDYYKKHQNDHSYCNDRDYYKKEFLKKSEKYKIFKENFDILMNSGVHKQADWITAIEDNEWHFYHMDKILDEANPINLKMILDKYPNIEIKTLLEHFDSSFFKDVKNENLCILFEKFPEIDIKSLYDYKFRLRYNLEDSDFKNYITKLFDFRPNISIDEFLWISGHIDIEGLLSCNNVDDFLGLICKNRSFRLDIYKLLVDHYNSLFLDKIGGLLKTERRNFFQGCYAESFESIKMLLNKFQNIEPEYLILLKYIRPENLKMVFDKYPKIEINELVLLENNNETIKMLLNKFQNIKPKYLILLNDVRPENLSVIFENLHNIEIDEIILLENKDTNTHILRLATPEILTAIFEGYPNIQIKELADLRFIEYPNFRVFFEGFWPIDFAIFNKYKDLFYSGLPITLNFKEENHKGYLKFLNEIMDTKYNTDKKSKMVEKVVTLTFEQAQNYVEVFKMLDDSISMDIKRVKNELIDELLESDDPKNAAKQIINIFERNNLPLTGKIFKVFELLYPKEKFKRTLEPHGSPVLHQYLNEGKSVYDLIYRDLMNIAIKSGDRSLRDYLDTFVGSEELLRKFEGIVNREGFDGNNPLCLDKKLSEDGQAKLLYLFRRISVLYNRYYGKEINEGNTIEDKKHGESTVADNQLVEFYNDIKKGFHLRKGESIYDRLQRFLLGLGYHSFDEVLKDMEKSKKEAHERGLNLYNEAKSNGGKIIFPKKAFLKGVYENAFEKIINRGVTSREYLGGGEDGKDSWNGSGGTGAGSDATPFDIDGLYINSPKNWTRYGPINLIIDINRCDIVDTRDKGLNGYKENQYELFVTGGSEHYGIRTGIPTTEVDHIIFNGSFDRTTKVKVPTEEHPDGEYIDVLSIFQNMCYEIARNGYYIPIVDNRGNVKFTPEMYHQIRAGFNYMQYYDGFDVEQENGKWVSKESDNEVHKKYTGTNKEKITDDGLGKLIADNSPNNEKYSGFAKENRELAENTIKWIKEILRNQCGINFNSKHDTSITGAELHDSGSTGRGTDIPTKDVDLDFTLLLDAKDYDEKLGLIKETIYRETGTSERGEEGPRKGGFQMKSKKNKIGERPDGIPLDLLILKKSQVIDYSSSDAMKEKLNYIANNSETGAENLDWVRTNVIIMKKLLKSQSCYKKTEAEGGIAGIGVENWITQHHGSFIEALESFEKVAFNGEYKAGSRPIPLKDFQELYPIYDAGENYKDGCNDNFVDKINEHGYNGMLKIVTTLRTKGIKGIEELIKEYERNKKAHIG